MAIQQPPYDPFSTFVDSLEMAQERAHLEQREQEATHSRKTAVIALGETMLVGGVTADAVCELAWQATERQRELLFKTGTASMGKPEYDSSGDRAVSVMGRPIPISNDMLMQLRFNTFYRGYTKGFYPLLDKTGLSGALDEYIHPSMCVVAVIDRNTHRVIDQNRLLGIDYASTETGFDEQWERSFVGVSQLPQFKNKFMRSRERIEKDVAISGNRLVVIAGLVGMHNAWLDELEANL